MHWEKRTFGLVAAVGVIVGAIAAVQQFVPQKPTASRSSTPLTPAQSTATRDGKFAGPLLPELQGISAWINSEPLMLEQARGKVVLIDFWTYT